MTERWRTRTALGERDRPFLQRIFDDQAEALRAAGSNETALRFLEKCRWPEQIDCPHCGACDSVLLETGRNAGKRRRQCRACRLQFSPTSGTALSGEKVEAHALLLGLALASDLRGLDLAAELLKRTALSRSSAARLALFVQDRFDRASARPGESLDHGSAPPVDRALRGRARVVASVAAVGVSAGVGALLLWLALRGASPMETRWISAGQERIVTTPRDGLEDSNAWSMRHAVNVTSARDLYPPDPRR